MNAKQMRDEILRLTAENTTLKANKPSAPTLSFKVSAKRGVSVYGLGRFPVTLYRDQWRRLFDVLDNLVQFIDTADEAGQLGSKGDTPPESAQLETSVKLMAGSMATARQAKAIQELMAEDGESLSKADVLAMLATQHDEAT